MLPNPDPPALPELATPSPDEPPVAASPGVPVPVALADSAPPDPVVSFLARWPDPEAKLDLLRRYVDALLAANARANLTGDRTPALQWTRHIEDALRAAAEIEAALGPPESGRRILDVGAGGGVPGIVWAILWPQAKVSLLEATGKKASFLREVASDLALANAAVLHGRAEDLARDPAHRDAYDLVAARALAPLRVLAELIVPFARRDGTAIAIKSRDVEAETQEAERAFKLLAAPLPPRLLDYDRSDGARCRALLYLKTGPTPPAYPRQANTIRKKPL